MALRLHRRAVSAAASLALVLGACSDDDCYLDGADDGGYWFDFSWGNGHDAGRQRDDG